MMFLLERLIYPPHRSPSPSSLLVCRRQSVSSWVFALLLLRLVRGFCVCFPVYLCGCLLLVCKCLDLWVGSVKSHTADSPSASTVFFRGNHSQALWMPPERRR